MCYCLARNEDIFTFVEIQTEFVCQMTWFVFFYSKSWSFLTIDATDVQYFTKTLSYSFLAWAENSKNIKIVILGRKLTKLEKSSAQLASNMQCSYIFVLIPKSSNSANFA